MRGGTLYLVVVAYALASLAAEQDVGPAAQAVGGRLGSALWWHLEPWLGELAGSTDLAIDAEYRRALAVCVHFALEAAGLLTLLNAAASVLDALGAPVRALFEPRGGGGGGPMRRDAHTRPRGDDTKQ